MIKLSNYYKNLKIIFIIADIFIIAAFSAIWTAAITSGQNLMPAIILTPIFALIITLIEVLILRYYQKVVISVDFIDDIVIIYTNKEKYMLPNKFFTCVKEEPTNGRTYILYDDGEKAYKFVFVMKYAFKTYHLDIAGMRKHMPYTAFE